MTPIIADFTFSALWNWLGAKWNQLIDWFLAPFIFIKEQYDALIDKMETGIRTAADSLADLAAAMTVNASPLATYLEYANAFFPLTECLIMAGLWLGLRMICIIVRLIKGAIPTYG